MIEALLEPDTDMDVMTLEVDDDGCGQLHLELPADATNEEIGCIKTLVERVGPALLELRDNTGSSCSG